MLLLQLLLSCLAVTLLIMCEAGQTQFLDAEFTNDVEHVWGKLRVVVNACGAHAESFTYPRTRRGWLLAIIMKGAVAVNTLQP